MLVNAHIITQIITFTFTQEWEEKASKAKEEYNAAMAKYKDSGAAAEFKEKKKQADRDRKQVNLSFFTFVI